MLNQILLIHNLIGLTLLLVLRLVGGKNTFVVAGMADGRDAICTLFVLGVVNFYGLQTLLNYVTGLGHIVDIR